MPNGDLGNVVWIVCEIVLCYQDVGYKYSRTELNRALENGWEKRLVVLLNVSISVQGTLPVGPI